MNTSTHTHTHTWYVLYTALWWVECSPHNTAVADALLQKKNVFFLFVSWPLNLNECCEQSQRQPLPLRRPVSKNKTTPLTETANYSVWPLLKYLMIFTSRQKCPRVAELPPRTFIGVTAASATASHREVKQATIVFSVRLLRVWGYDSSTEAVSQRWALRVFVMG